MIGTVHNLKIKNKIAWYEHVIQEHEKQVHKTHENPKINEKQETKKIPTNMQHT